MMMVLFLANALMQSGTKRSSAQSPPPMTLPARTLATRTMQTLRDAAYRASIELAREKGPFPGFKREAFLASGFASRLPEDIRDAIQLHIASLLAHGEPIPQNENLVHVEELTVGVP